MCFDADQQFARRHLRAGTGAELDHGAVDGRFDAVLHLHGFDGEHELALAHALAKLDRQLDEVMTKTPVTCDSGTAVIAALSQMTQRRIRHLPVVDGGRLVGFVSIGDLVKYRIDKIEAEAAAMRDYIAS